MAVAELRAAATDASGTLRTDLLGEIAGIHLGAEAYRSEHGGVERGHAARAELVLAAGADPDVAQAWRAEGYQRARPVMPPRT